MSRSKITTAIFIFLLTSLAVASDVSIENEDALLMNAIVSEESGDLQGAMGIYDYLYKQTGKIVYLVHGARDMLATPGKSDYYAKEMQKCVDKEEKGLDDSFYRILVALYIKTGESTKANEIADRYIKFSDSIEDQLALADLKRELGDPASALYTLLGIYNREPSDDLVVEISDLLGEIDMPEMDSIILLEKHISKYQNSSPSVYFALINLYARQNNFDRVLQLYKELYMLDGQEYYLQQIVELSLEKKDYDGAISFLRKSHNSEAIIFSFYVEKGELDKAIELARKLYDRDADPKWIAEEAMLTFEKADLENKADADAMNKMQNLMNEALAKGVRDPVYLNYYGYILIDRDIDPNRGVELIRRALRGNEKNPFYLDSLAWGQYKLGMCSEAYKNMINVLTYGGYSEPDIREHWRLIEECKKKMMNWR